MLSYICQTKWNSCFFGLLSAFNKSLVIASESKKNSNLGSLLVVNRFDLSWIDWQSFLRNYITKKLYFYLQKMTLWKLHLKLMLPQCLKHYSKINLMVSLIFRIYQNAIYKHQNKPIQMLLENSVQQVYYKLAH